MGVKAIEWIARKVVCRTPPPLPPPLARHDTGHRHYTTLESAKFFIMIDVFLLVSRLAWPMLTHTHWPTWYPPTGLDYCALAQGWESALSSALSIAELLSSAR